MRAAILITEIFAPRTLANMDVALERACHAVSGSEDHRVRRRIASKIVECAKGGDITLTGLTEAGRIAASRLGGHPGRLTGKAGWKPSICVTAGSR
jgi:hypothetical protein